MKSLKVIRNPQEKLEVKGVGCITCPRCFQEVDLSNHGGEVAMPDWDGHCISVTCSCNCEFTVSASVEFTATED